MASQEGINQDQMVDPGIDQRLQTQSMFETLARIPECSELLKLIEAADLAYALRRSGLRTLFAPQNDALKGTQPRDMDELLPHLTVNGAMETFDLRRCSTVKTVAGDTVEVRPEESTIKVGAACILRADVPCTNGVIQIVDQLLTA